MTTNRQPNRKRAVLTEDQESRLVEQYTTRQPDGTWVGANTIASLWGIAPPTVYKILRRHGVPTRDARESHAHGKRCKPIKNLPPEDVPAPLCKCGCGEPAPWNRRENAYRAYCPGHYRRHALYKEQDWIYNAYVVERRTLAEIAAQFGVDIIAIIRSMDKFGIPRRSRSESRIGRKNGAKNPAWKGGVTPERQRIYRTQEWLAVVRQVYERDHHLCQRCGSPTSPHAHHIKPWADYPELRLDPDNLITLCETCHLWVHSSANVNRDYLG